MIILIPPQVYFERVQQGRFRGSFLEFLPHAVDGGPYPQGNISAGQLWFLFYLFAYSLLMLPLFRFLRGERGRRWISRLAGFCQRRGALFVLSVPLIIGQIALGWRYPETHNPINDWMFHWVLLWVFLYGYILFSDQRFQQAIDRDWIIALGVAIATSVGMLLLLRSDPSVVIEAVLGFGRPWMLGSLKGKLLYALGSTLLRLNTWAWLLLILALARRLLNFTNAFLRYTSLASGAVYVFHQTVIIAVAFYVLRWKYTLHLKVGMTVEFLVIFALSLAITMLLYELARRWVVTRLLFGLKVRGKPKPASAPETTASSG
jgi:hypothetical protein